MDAIFCQAQNWINVDKCMLILTVTSVSILDHTEKDITRATIELPVSPQQEAEDHMRKWNIRFQQELTPVFVTQSRDGNKKLDHQS